MGDLKLIVSGDEIIKRVDELAVQITEDYQGKSVVFLGILKGAFIFLADLIRRVKLDRLEVDFIRLASYGQGDSSSGEIQITKDIEISLKGKDVIVVEDIIDTGLTLRYLTDHLKAHQPNSVKICCLIDKIERRKINIDITYRGFVIPEGFLVGYGLDYAEKYRHLNGIYEIVRRR